MQVKEMKEAFTEKLIKRLCAIWGIETKWARTEEKQIAKELEGAE